MLFCKKRKSIFKIKKQNHFQIFEQEILIHPKYPLFGIVEYQNQWILLHVLSERALISKFSSQDEIERYFPYLCRETNLKSIFLMHPDFDLIEQEIRYDVEIAYQKFIKDVKK